MLMNFIDHITTTYNIGAVYAMIFGLALIIDGIIFFLIADWWGDGY